jgi:glycerol-3-phosphate acyltransferase PlsY
VLIIVILTSYLLGSIPFSYLVARGKGVDVRQVGSGNVGATNVMRSAGKGAGALAFALDFAKGALAVVVARAIAGTYPAGDPTVIASFGAVMAVVGHVFPIWLRFKGGKGVSTGAGAMAPLAPLATGLAIVAFALALAVTRYVSLASMIGAVLLAVIAFVTPGHPAVYSAAAACAAVIVAKHRGNIGRLRRGEERRLGDASAS